MDPFDDVRNTAATILKGRMPSASVCTTNGSSTQHGDSPKEADFLDETRLDTKTLDQAIINAQSLVNRTGRADYADGFARLCELKCDYLIREASPSEVGDRLAGTVTKHLKALESCIEGLEGSVYNSSTGLPLHGLLIALRCVWRPFVFFMIFNIRVGISLAVPTMRISMQVMAVQLGALGD